MQILLYQNSLDDSSDQITTASRLNRNDIDDKDGGGEEGARKSDGKVTLTQLSTKAFLLPTGKTAPDYSHSNEQDTSQTLLSYSHPLYLGRHEFCSDEGDATARVINQLSTNATVATSSIATMSSVVNLFSN